MTSWKCFASAAALALAGATLTRADDTDQRRGRDVPESDLLEMVL